MIPQSCRPVRPVWSETVRWLAAFVIDQTVATTLCTFGTAAVNYVLELLSDETTQITVPTWLLGSSYVVWLFIYSAYPWATSGKTLGMACLGMVGIVTNREHRALHDRGARTVVVYDWDARGARLRFLARRASRPQLDETAATAVTASTASTAVTAATASNPPASFAHPPPAPAEPSTGVVPDGI